MELTFENGTDLQKTACRTALHNLLNLPFDSIPFFLTIEFTPDPLPSKHNEFAVTETEVGSLEAFTKIASIAPNWPIPWDGIQFLQETTAHEFAHGLFAALPEKRRLEIAEMFGASSTDPGEINPETSKWEDRINEGIAETFKDAFLPPDLRRYFNRTNHKIPISEYPRFRRIFREGVAELAAETEGEEGGEPFDHDVLELDYDTLRDAWEDSEDFELQVGPNFFTRTYKAGYDLFIRAVVPKDHTFAFDFELPEIPGVDFITTEGPRSRESVIGLRYRITINGANAHKFRGAWAFANLSELEAIQFHGDHWRPDSVAFDPGADRVPSSFATWWSKRESFLHPYGVPWEGPENANYILFEDAIAAGVLPWKFSTSVPVKAGDEVTIHIRVIGWEAIAPGVAEEPAAEERAKEFAKMIFQAVAEALPEMHYTVTVTPVEVEPIELPTPEIVPESMSQSARRQDRNRVSNVHFGQ